MVDSQSESNLALLHKRLVHALREPLGEELKRIEICQVLRRPYSLTTFLIASTCRSRHRLVLKQIVEHPLNAPIVDELAQATVEYNILSQLYPMFAGIERCSVPRPILVLPEINAFLMEHIEGQLLADNLKFVHYLGNRIMFRQLQNAFYDCGRWLRYFQQFFLFLFL